LGGDQLERGRAQAVGREGLVQPQEAGGHQQGRDLQRGAAESPDQDGGGEDGPNRGAERERRDRDPRVDGREVLTELQVEGEHDERPHHAGEEDEDGGESGGVGAVAEDRGLDERVTAASGCEAAPDRQRVEAREAAGAQQVGPGRPTGATALDQRVDEQAHGDRAESAPDEVQSRATRRT
jgi:hypothetical protein